MRILVSTRANLYDQRKQEHLERGYRIEDERPISVNGFCSFVAVREESYSGAVDELVAQAHVGDEHRHRDHVPHATATDRLDRFVDFLAGSGCKLWQVLPLGPTGYGDSSDSSILL